MTRSEQHQLIQELKDLSRFLKGKELYDLEMFLKRDRDDEDLDHLAQRRLEELLEQCRPLKPKSKVKNPFEP